jgi:hypothetical protein
VAVSFTGFDLVLRAPILIWMTGRTGHVRTAELVRCLWPAWTCALPMSGVLVAVHAMTPTGPSWVRLGLGVALALSVGAAALWLAPWGRSALRDGVRMFRSLKADKRVSG